MRAALVCVLVSFATVVIALSPGAEGATTGAHGGDPVGTPLSFLGIAITVSVAFATMVVRDAGQVRMDTEDLRSLIENALDRGEHQRALDLSEEALRLSPKSVRIHLDHAWLLSRLHRPADALACLERDPLRDDPDALLLGARVAWAEGAREEAARKLARAVELAPLVLVEMDEDPTLRPIMDADGAREVVEATRRRLEGRSE